MPRTLTNALLLSLLLAAFSVHARKEQAVTQSAYDVPTTADRLVTAVEEKGLKVFSRIDHAAGAASAGMELAPTVLVLFGNPAIGTKLMHCGHGVAIDLPFKALIWEGQDGKTRLAYTPPAVLAQRHDLDGCDPVVAKVSGVLAALARAATE